MKSYRAWSGALSVLVITVALVVLDVSDRSISRYWSGHTFTSSVLAGLLVLFLTVLIVDRVAVMRQLRNQSRAIAAQAAVIVAQAGRAADAIKGASKSGDDRDVASDELRTYMQMLLTSAPVLITATQSRAFLEAAQHAAAELFRARQEAADKGAESANTRVDKAIGELRRAAEPLLAPLNRDQQAAAAGSDPTGPEAS